MKHAIIGVIISAAAALPVEAQSFGEIVELARGNAHVKALRAARDAAKDNANTGLTLANPEVELGYQLGYPHESVPNRTQVTVTQELDMPTLSGAKRNVAQQTCRLLDAQYDAAEWQAMKDTEVALTELTACNRQVKELRRRCKLATQLAEAYKKAIDNGDATEIDVNRAIIEWQTIEAAHINAETERAVLLARLEELCGTEVIFEDTTYRRCNLPADFDVWFAANGQRLPQLRIATQHIEVAKAEQKLTRKETLPSLSVGYSGEIVRGNNYHGAVVGFSLPLWGNKGKSKAAETAVQQANEERRSEQVRLYSEYKQMYLRAVQYHAAADRQKATLAASDNAQLLRKALSEGNISLIDYILETKNCYDLIDCLNESEREAALAALWFASCQ